MEKINRIGGKIELTNEECEKLYNNGEIFLIAYRTVWQLKYSKNIGWYGIKVYYHDKYNNYLPLTKAGRFVTYTASETNKLIGREIFTA